MKPLSRRTLLRGAGGVAIGLPLLSAMSARAQTPAPPKRLILLFSPNGTIAENWLPKAGATEDAFSFSPILAPLEPWRSKLLILGNVDLAAAKASPGTGHQNGIGALFTGQPLEDSNLFGFAGWARGPSIDQEIARLIGGGTRFGSLELAVQPPDATVASRMSYRGPSQPLPPQTDPIAVFDRLFSSFDADPVVAEARRARRKSILDAVKTEFDAVKRQVGAEDLHRLDAHVTSIREVEQRLDATFKVSADCRKPDSPELPPLSDPASYPAITQAHLDLTALALACDLTRVVSLQWSGGAGAAVFSWLGTREMHHELSHHADNDAPATAMLTAIHHWYSQQVASLLDRLTTITEAGEPLLDRSLVVWGNEMGRGNDHSYASTPFVLAGSAGGYFRTGRFLDRKHESHNNLLVSCLNAFGSPVTTFGDPAFCQGPMSGLT